MSVNFDDMPPPQVGEETFEIPGDDGNPEQVKVEGPLCEACNRVIVRKPGTRGRTPKWHPECRPKPVKATASKRKPKNTPSYEEGLQSLFQMTAFGLFIAAGDSNKPIMADSKAVAEHGPGIASALNQLAMEKPEVAAVLDKILAVGPYSLVIASVAPLVMQIAANHGVPIPNVAGPDEYLAVKQPVGQ